MTVPSLPSRSGIGAAGQALVIYRLRALGVPAVEAPEGLPYDLVAFHETVPLRVQVKTTSKFYTASEKSFRWSLLRGRYGDSHVPRVDQGQYTAQEADLIALAALPTSAVMFLPVPQYQERITISADVMNEPQTTWDSFITSVCKVKTE